MPLLLDNVSIIIDVFNEYARQKEGCPTLTRREMKTLIQKEFADVVENPQDPQPLALACQLLDINGDGVVDFDEYLLLIFRVAKVCFSQLQPRGRVHQEGDASRGQRELWGDERTSHQQRISEREGRDVHERRDSGWTHLRPGEAGTRPEQRRDCLPDEPVDQEDERHHQARDPEPREGRRRYRQSPEPQDREDEYKGRSDDYDASHPLPSDGDRRSQSRDPGDEQRRSWMRESDRRGRSSSQDSGLREDGWGRQQLPEPQARERRSDQLHEQERRRPRDQEERTGLERCGPATRAKSQRRAHGTEHREQERSCLHPGECDGSESEKRTRFHEPGCRDDDRRRPPTQVSREGDWRRQQDWEAEPSERDYERRAFQHREPRDMEREASRSRDRRARPTEKAQDGSFPSENRPREDDQSGEQIYEPEPREIEWRSHRACDPDNGDGEQGRPTYFEPKARGAEGRRSQEREPESSEAKQGRRWYCEDDENVRGGQRGSELRRDKRRKPQPRGTEPQERERTRQQMQDPKSTPEKTTSPQAGKPQAVEGPPNRPQSRQNSPDSRFQQDSEGCGPTEKERIPGQSRQPPVRSVSWEGGCGLPTPTEVPSEEGDGSSPQAQAPQPPLDTENQPGSETPQHVGESEACEHDTSQENKAPSSCNPLYEYLLAQKNLE